MISSFRNFAKTKFAGLLVFLMIIPFVFWGMGSMFSSGNTNNLAKINKTNISTKDFLEYLGTTNISQQVIKENINNNIIQELLSGLISTILLDLEIKDFNIIMSEVSLSKKIKENKNFIDEKGVFQRTKYEKFLLENNLNAPIFEQRLRKRESQKKLFDYIGAGSVSPKFLISKLQEEENKKLELDFIDLDRFYKKEDNITDQDLMNFLDENGDQLKVEYIDFNYSIINPKNLTGDTEFNQSFFDKIDLIESEILNGKDFDILINDFKLKKYTVNNFKYSENSKDLEKKIYESRNNKYDIFENGDNFIIYNIKSIKEKKPNLNDNQTKKEILKLVVQKNKFNYNKNLLEQIDNKEFSNIDFKKLGSDQIKTTVLNSIKDNNKFDIKSVQLLYSLPVNSFTLISDEKNKIYLTKIKKFEDKIVDIDSKDFEAFIKKENTNNRNEILKSYDIYLNKKYNVVINQKTVDRVKNFFQ
jgi:peptidyl-prolyl cis-trans isomerase D